MATDDRSDWGVEIVAELAVLLRTLPDQLLSIQLDVRLFARANVAVPENVRATLADACERLHKAVEEVAAIASKIQTVR